ncbi:MAG: ribose-phosphate pyrophosphokinase [Pseudomonadota bacterium]
MVLISGRANPILGKKISTHIGTPLTDPQLSCFKDGELACAVSENVRGCDVFVIQPTNRPANDHLMELLIMIEALRRASAKRITAIIPYYGYSRQDRKPTSRAPITAKLVARLIETAGAHRLVTADLHADQIQGFFDIAVDNLYCRNYLAGAFKTYLAEMRVLEKLVVVAPDVGGVARARSFAKIINADLVIVDKRRERANESEVMNIIGDVDGRYCILVDDIVDTAGTLCNAATALIEKGAKTVAAACVHGVFSPPALERINRSPIAHMFVTNTIQPSLEVVAHSKIKIVCIATLIAQWSILTLTW